MINSSLQSQFQDLKTVNKAQVNVVVELQPTQLVSTMAQKILAELVRMAPYAGYAPISDLEAEDIEKYLKTLLWLRVQRVTGAKTKGENSYYALSRHVPVPVLYYQVLISVGEAYDRDFNIQFLPAYNINGDDVLSPEEMDAIGSILRSFEQSGLKLVYGMPRDTSGELDFMAMSHVEDQVVSYRRSHPVYGFLASFFAQQKLNEITGMMCRIIYGYDSDYKAMLSALFNAIDA